MGCRTVPRMRTRSHLGPHVNRVAQRPFDGEARLPVQVVARSLSRRSIQDCDTPPPNMQIKLPHRCGWRVAASRNASQLICALGGSAQPIWPGRTHTIRVTHRRVPGPPPPSREAARGVHPGRSHRRETPPARLRRPAVVPTRVRQRRAPPAALATRGRQRRSLDPLSASRVQPSPLMNTLGTACVRHLGLHLLIGRATRLRTPWSSNETNSVSGIMPDCERMCHKQGRNS